MLYRIWLVNTIVESSLLRMRKPCLFLSSSTVGSCFSSSGLSLSPSAGDCRHGEFQSKAVKVKQLNKNTICDLSNRRHKQSERWLQQITFSGFSSQYMTVHMSWHPGSSNVVTTCGLMLFYKPAKYITSLI